MNTAARLKRIEDAMAAKADDNRRGCYDRVFHLAIAEGDEDEGYSLLREHGWTDADDELVIIHTIVTPAGQEPYSEPPHFLYRPPEARP